MPIGRYRITSPTIAVFHRDGRHVADLVPEGAIIKIASEKLDGEINLVDVVRNGRAVMMFAQDLRTRATLMVD